MTGTLLVPTGDDPPPSGRWELVERDVLTMAMAEDGDGLMVPVFATPDALAGWRPEGGTYVERDARWLAGVMEADPDGRVVVDCGSPHQRIIPAALVAGGAEVVGESQAHASVASGDEVVGEAQARALVATPTEDLPQAIEAALRDVLGAESVVRSARLFVVDEGDGGSLQPVVFVDVGSVPDEVAVDAMGRIVQALASRAPDAAGLRLALVTPPWRATYDSGGSPLLG